MTGLVSTYNLINHDRATVKRQINDKLGSKIVEEKSYADYKSGVPS